jgi:hypothetical protein
METSRFIKTYHPRTHILPTAEMVATTLKRGWCGQVKMKGHRIQAHILPDGKIVSYTRQGQRHTTPLSRELQKELRAMAEAQILTLEGEWLKGLNKIFLFDVLQTEGNIFSMTSYDYRHEVLTEKYKAGSHLFLLEKLTTVDQCMEILMGDDPNIEGLVFKDQHGKGWSDGKIVRCLKLGIYRGF